MLLSCSSGIKPVSEHSNIEIRKATPGLYPTRIQINGDVQQNAQETITRVRAMFNNIQLSVSPYDTAWVAMAPSFDSKHMPCFPQCLNWIIKNQQASGSWSLDPSHQLLVKESLSSTLACVLALHKWNAGELIVNKGLDFLLSNSWAIEDKNQFSPVGFDIIFPGMIQYAKDIGLNLPLDSSSVDVILQKRDREVERALNIGSERTKRDLAYVSEGLSGLIDWKDVMKYQRSNGSLFNSPATTAAALTHHSDDKSFMYLQSLLDRYGNAAPTIFPLDKYIGLSLVETLVRLGLDRYFKTEIKGILDETYRCWLQGSDEIFLDITCCALGFRLLRMNGYGVSSDSLSQFCTQEQCFNFRSTRVIDTETVLELYRASQTIIIQSDPVLENIYSWTHSFLNQVVADGACHEKKLNKEVEYALKYSIHASLDRLETKKNIELYEPDKVGLLKASYRFFNADQNNDMLALSVQDFNMCQAKLREELEELELWAKEYKLDQIKYSRLRVSLAYFTIASVLFCPEYSVARMAWGKGSTISGHIDDFFDKGSSTEEQLNITELAEKWDEHSSIGFCSEQVAIFFTTIYDMVDEFAAKGFPLQGQSIRNHLMKAWHGHLKALLSEANWKESKSIPSEEDYMSFAEVTAGLEVGITQTRYFLGSELSEEAVSSREYSNLLQHVSVITRLLNDLASDEREIAEGKLHSVSLRAIHGAITTEEAVKEIRKLIDSHRRELLKMVLQTKGSVVPKACKDLIWKANKVVGFVYNMDTDGYSHMAEMIDAVNAVIFEPVIMPPSNKKDKFSA